jgi:hypothetical protein
MCPLRVTRVDDLPDRVLSVSVIHKAIRERSLSIDLMESFDDIEIEGIRLAREKEARELRVDFPECFVIGPRRLQTSSGRFC